MTRTDGLRVNRSINAINYLQEFIATALDFQTDEEMETQKNMRAHAVRSIEEKEKIEKWRNARFK